MRLSTILVLLVSVLAPVALRLMIGGLNYKRKIRYRQFFFPWITLIYCVLCVVFYDLARGIVDDIMRIDWVRNLFSLNNTPLQFTYASDIYSLFVLNLLAGAGLFALKLILLPPGRLVCLIRKKIRGREDKAPSARSEDSPYWRYIGKFYDIGEDSPVLSPKWSGVRSAVKGGLLIMTALFLLLFVFIQLPALADFSWYPYDPVLRIIERLYAWPAITLLLLWECCYFLDGTQFRFDRKESEFFFADLSSRLQVNYDSLVTHYKKQFPERYVGTLTAQNYPLDSVQPTFKNELVQEIQKELTRLKNTALSQSALDCLYRLPDGENVVVDSGLYSDIGFAMMIWLNIMLAQGENALFLCEDEAAAEEVRKFISDALKQINFFAPVWIVKDVGDAQAAGDADVLVLTPQAIFDERVHAAQKRFFARMSTVFVVETSRIIAAMSTYMSLAASKLDEFNDTTIRYICMNVGIPREMRTTLMEVLSPGRDFNPYECFHSADTTRVLLWNYESCNGTNTRTKAQNNLFGSAMQRVYLGVSVPLACVGLNFGVDRISILGKSIPWAELTDALKENASGMYAYFGDHLQSDGFADRICFNRIEGRDPFVIVLDETNNLPMTIRGGSRYLGQTCAMVHIVSKPYMLRDYFSNHVSDYLTYREKAEMFSAMAVNTRRIAATRLIAEACGKNGLKEERLLDGMREEGGPVPALYDALRACCLEAFGPSLADRMEDLFSISAETDFSEKKNSFITQRVIRLYDKDAAVLPRLLASLQPAVAETDSGEATLGMERGNIWQYHLPDQGIVLHGRMYDIKSIDMKTGRLKTGHRREALDLAADYIQHRFYRADIREAKVKSTSMRIAFPSRDSAAEAYEVALLEQVKLTAETYGYLSSHPCAPGLNLTDLSSYHRLEKSVEKQALRRNDHASVLTLSIYGIQEGKADRVSFTLAVLLSELMKTLYPYNWPCIAVCPVLSAENAARVAPRTSETARDPLTAWPDSSLSSSGLSFEQLGLAYPQVSLQTNDGDKPDSAAQVLFIDDSEHGTGILDTLFLNRERPLQILFQIIHDYLRWRNNFVPSPNISADYLFFGSDSMPDCLDLEYVELLAGQMQTVSSSERVYADGPEERGTCYFCSRKLYETHYHVLNDEDGNPDRMVCEECHKSLCSRKSELVPLYRKTRDYLEKTFGITLEKNVKVRFTSSTEMKKRINENDSAGRLVGLAEKNGNIVSIETNSPVQNILATLVHELTHIWQYANIKYDDLVMVEGHASYMQVLFMRAEGYLNYANSTHEELLRRQDDPYGQGYVKMLRALEGKKDGDPFKYMRETFPPEQQDGPK